MPDNRTQATLHNQNDAEPSNAAVQANPDSFLKNAIKTSLKVLFAAGLIYWLIQKGALDLNQFRQLATPTVILLCFGLTFIQIFFNNIRWLALLRAQEFESSIRQTLPLSLIGMFFNFAMPGGVGGDVIKGYYLLQEHPRQRFAAAISIFMDRMIGFFVMVGTAFLALFFNWDSVSHSPQLRSIALAVVLLFTAFIVFFGFSLSRRMTRFFFSSLLGRILFEKLPGGGKIKRVYENIHAYRRSPKALFYCVLLSLVNQLSLVAFVSVIANAMNVDHIPLAVYFFLVPVGMVILALPISPAGIGVGQAAFFFLFSLYLGESSKLGPTAVTAMQIMNFAWGMVGAYFYLQRKKPVTTAQA